MGTHSYFIATLHWYACLHDLYTVTALVLTFTALVQLIALFEHPVTALELTFIALVQLVA
jgi:hypothetical protein